MIFAAALAAGPTTARRRALHLGVAVPRGSAGGVDSDEVMDFINARLGSHPYIVGEKFTAADILYASAFALFMNSPLLEGKRTQQLQDYVARCVSRPARARSSTKDQSSS